MHFKDHLFPYVFVNINHLETKFNVLYKYIMLYYNFKELPSFHDIIVLTTEPVNEQATMSVDAVHDIVDRAVRKFNSIYIRWEVYLY